VCVGGWSRLLFREIGASPTRSGPGAHGQGITQCGESVVWLLASGVLTPDAAFGAELTRRSPSSQRAAGALEREENVADKL
jgi:hypothetical protein